MPNTRIANQSQHHQKSLRRQKEEDIHPHIQNIQENKHAEKESLKQPF